MTSPFSILSQWNGADGLSTIATFGLQLYGTGDFGPSYVLLHPSKKRAMAGSSLPPARPSRVPLSRGSTCRPG